MQALNTKQFYGFCGLFGLCAILSVLLFQPYILVAPFLLLAFLWICHDAFRLFYLLLAALPWSVEYNFTPSLGTDLPTEPLMLLVSFAMLCFLVYYARYRPMEGFFASPLTLLLLAQATWWLISAYFSADPGVSFKFCIAKSWYLAAFVVTPFVVFRNPKHLKTAARIYAGSMLLLCAYTMWRHAHYGFTFERINDSLWPHFRNHVNYSAVLVSTIPILVAAYALASNKRHKRIMMGVLAFAGLALLLSYARGAWLAGIVGAAAFWLLRRRVLIHGFLIFIFGACLSVTALIDNQRYMHFSNDFNTTVFHTNFEDHLRATYQFKDVSTAERFYRWIAGVRMIHERWATGWGPNTFSKYYQRYTIPAFRTWVSANSDHSTVHNYYLLTTIEQGYAGLVFLLLLIGYALYTGQKVFHKSSDPLWRAAAAVGAIILVMQCTVNLLNDLVETDKLGSLFYLSIALIIAADAHLRRERKTADLS